MLKPGCTIPNQGVNCRHSSTSAKFCPITESDKVLVSKVREDMVEGPSIVFTHKAVVDETQNCKTTIVCKSIVGIDASQLHPCSLCQLMLTRIYSSYEFDADSQRFHPFGTNPEVFKLCSYRSFNERNRNALTQQELTKVLIVSMQMGFVDIARLRLMQGFVFIIAVHVKLHELH